MVLQVSLQISSGVTWTVVGGLALLLLFKVATPFYLTFNVFNRFIQTATFHFPFVTTEARRRMLCSARERRLGVYRCCRKWVLTRKQNLRFDIIYCRLSSAWYLRFNESKTTKYQKIEAWSENKPFWRGGAGRVVNVSAAPVQALLVISLPDWTLLIFSDNRGSSWPVNMSVLVYYSSAKKKKKASEWCRGSVWCWGSIHTLIWVQEHTHTHTLRGGEMIFLRP